MDDSPISWQDEAKAVINDVEALVNSINISSKIKADEQNIYLNVITLENNYYCIELSPRGFRVVGNAHDSINVQDEVWYDTPYALLSQISESYTLSFANALISKLQKMQNDE